MGLHGHRSAIVAREKAPFVPTMGAAHACKSTTSRRRSHMTQEQLKLKRQKDREAQRKKRQRDKQAVELLPLLQQALEQEKAKSSRLEEDVQGLLTIVYKIDAFDATGIVTTSSWPIPRTATTVNGHTAAYWQNL